MLVGGCATELLVTDPGAPAPRPTRDVDLLVQVVTLAEYYAVEEEMRNLGFRQGEDDAGVLCRWSMGELLVDVMPTEEGILGFGNRWYAEAETSARSMELEPGLEVRVINAPCFLGTKLEAFLSRGEGDYVASHDLEDMIAVIDGRAELPGEVADSPDDLREYLVGWAGKLLSDSRFQEALPGLLPPDQASQGRVGIVLSRLEQIMQS